MREKIQNKMSGILREDEEEVRLCLCGEKLYGDDFPQEKINEWFKDEQEGYFNLVSTYEGNQGYGFHALNMEYGFRYLLDGMFSHVLGVGSANGDELLPIVTKSKRITILEPSEGFVVTQLNGVPVEYQKPQPEGVLPFSEETFDLITCLGVLHHIPNVSKVINEFYRVLQPGGYALIREPIISMGDWRNSRHGLTKRERGIPFKIFRNIIRIAGFEVIREQKCMFSLTARLSYILRHSAYNSRFVVLADRLLCSLPVWSSEYHSSSFYQKLRPVSVFYVLRKPK